MEAKAVTAKWIPAAVYAAGGDFEGDARTTLAVEAEADAVARPVKEWRSAAEVSLPAHASSGDVTPAACPTCGWESWTEVAPGTQRCGRCQTLRFLASPGRPPLESRDFLLHSQVRRLVSELPDGTVVINASYVRTPLTGPGGRRPISQIPPHVLAAGGSRVPAGAGACLMLFALEQAEKPDVLLDAARRMMAPKAKLLLQTVNPTSLVSLLSESRGPLPRIPGQKFYFRQEHVQRLLSRAGFSVQRVTRASMSVAGRHGWSRCSFSPMALLGHVQTLCTFGSALLFEAEKC
jgi:hypothetical protein